MPQTVTLNNVHLTLNSRAGAVAILKGIDVEAQAGEAIGIVGPSGSGKTSLLMVMAGLESVTSGEITVADVRLNDRSESDLAKFRRENIGIIFQSFHLIPTMTALENVAVPLEFKGEKDAFARAREGLVRVGLGHRLDHYPGQLSGGEQQRVAIARAVTSGAKILLADEPTGNLDQETGASIIDLLFDLKEKTKATLLLVTHDVSLAQRCNRIWQVRDGKVTEPASAGKPRKALNMPASAGKPRKALNMPASAGKPRKDAK
ncbi:MAG: ATP-binding cassette domain-containing protein [Alphaproteobacteria bacterium]|nr:ATP-binding cassette domain-containing protein [Alphaproteobacteria bacterium]